MKKVVLLVVALFAMSLVSVAQETKKNETKLTQAEKQELKADKKAFKATLSDAQKTKLKRWLFIPKNKKRYTGCSL